MPLCPVGANVQSDVFKLHRLKSSDWNASAAKIGLALTVAFIGTAAIIVNSTVIKTPGIRRKSFPIIFMTLPFCH
jgi:hypothetical protein